MANRIFRSILMVASLVLLITTGFVIRETNEIFTSFRTEQLKAKTELIAYGIERDGLSFLDSLDETEYRITVIDREGSVIYDNREPDLLKLDNHLNREEFIEALETGYGTSTRLSSSLMERMTYNAIALHDGYLLRLGNSSVSIYYVITLLTRPLILLMMLITAISFYIAYTSTKRIVSPLNSIDTSDIDEENCYKEIKPILNKLANQQVQINRDRDELARRKQEFETITGNMNGGMILLNSAKTIVECNRKAYEILGVDRTIVSQPVSSMKEYSLFSGQLNDASKGQHSSKRVRLSDAYYEIEVSPIIVEEEIIGYMILFFDISYLETNEQLRKEFTSNVSHELKTPLQSISGYAELLKNGMVNPEDEKSFYSKIYNESQRMIDLINDVIRVSNLDDSESDFSKQLLDLHEECQTVIRNMRDSCPADMEIVYEGTSAGIYGNRELVLAIISNLIENAVKYSGDSRKVYVSVSHDERSVFLSVRDEGTGIPEEDRDRIFERFYRVDKGHTSSISGTGIGLSIVKHACIINNASIDVESEVGKGSTFTVTFARP